MAVGIQLFTCWLINLDFHGSKLSLTSTSILPYSESCMLSVLIMHSHHNMNFLYRLGSRLVCLWEF